MLPLASRDNPNSIAVTEPCWLAADHHSDAPDSPLIDWLTDQGSLTQRLTAAGDGEFAVELLRQCEAPARADEAAALGVPTGSPLWIREVMLWSAGQPRVFARSAATTASVSAAGLDLQRLGTRSLGELLFSHPEIQRGPLEISRYPADWLPIGRQEQGCWARRSLFRRSGLQLLVCEVFLGAWQQLVSTPLSSH
ncbi:chorismate--pyruvate lyase family protein [Halopseudomonas salegens]|uniref:Probable chorismate pyruvate-lyase n=1 Tax=Halopseudomonas salegens TaxID=1434072 RepID=A0A1H2HS26_9GAMM|nr:chorismate lyase [Halopseudomonas salegens]SDU34701.1 chorismate lyase [Halopseudomonas salegens]